jgi:hypothetical protein
MMEHLKNLGVGLLCITGAVACFAFIVGVISYFMWLNSAPTWVQITTGAIIFLGICYSVGEEFRGDFIKDDGEGLH